uniref:Uncharacterized protein n=1 Tax=Arundo donax TaxID=35708 RepID=A0A0A9ELB6_ARUDO
MQPDTGISVKYIDQGCQSHESLQSSSYHDL